MGNNEFDIYRVIKETKERRKIFTSEADFQLELAWSIKSIYQDAKVRMEYCPFYGTNVHIDILVFLNDKMYPIELKYKTKEMTFTDDNEKYSLKNHYAKNINCYLYYKDIQRIETFKNYATEVFFHIIVF